MFICDKRHYKLLVLILYLKRDFIGKMKFDNIPYFCPIIREYGSYVRSQKYYFRAAKSTNFFTPLSYYIMLLFYLIVTFRRFTTTTISLRWCAYPIWVNLFQFKTIAKEIHHLSHGYKILHFLPITIFRKNDLFNATNLIRKNRNKSENLIAITYLKENFFFYNGRITN